MEQNRPILDPNNRTLQLFEDSLILKARQAISHPTSSLNDIEINRVFSEARKMNLDGRKFLWQALNEIYNPSPATKTISHTDLQPATGYQCPICHKEFKSQAALSGHGVNRCKG